LQVGMHLKQCWLHSNSWLLLLSPMEILAFWLVWKVLVFKPYGQKWIVLWKYECILYIYEYVTWRMRRYVSWREQTNLDMKQCIRSQMTITDRNGPTLQHTRNRLMGKMKCTRLCALLERSWQRFAFLLKCQSVSQSQS
jgi:hypothetical protein